MKTKVILKSDLPQQTIRDYLTERTLLTVGKCYEASLIPLYDSKTGEAYFWIKIYCDDGYARKFPMNYFITLEEYRDLQLEKILI
jgi:hypothetical protein